MAKRQFFSRSSNLGRRAVRRTSRSDGYCRLEPLEQRLLLAAEVEVLKDIMPGSTGSLFQTSFSDYYTTAAEFDGWVYFAANDGINGRELWRTDGTALNTTLFADLKPGAGNSDPNIFFVANGRLYFQAQGPTGYGLFVTDGTLAGTKQLSTAAVGKPVGVIGSTVYFYLEGHMSNAGAFWKSDGTSAGTVKFAFGEPETGVKEPLIFDNTVIYTFADDRELWKVDIETGVKSRIAIQPENVAGLTVLNGELYFAGNTTNSFDPTHLWKLTSATGIPTRVQDPNSARIALNPESLTVADEIMYFVANSSTGDGIELWRTDGTSAGTVMVKDINPTGHAFPFASRYDILTVVGDNVFFAADDGVHGAELWKSGGLASNTTLVKDIVPGNDSSGEEPQNLFNLNGLLTFIARTAASPDQVLWTSDGSEAGTASVSGESFRFANSFVALGSNMIFAAENGTVGREPFIFRNGERPQAPVITAPSGVVSSLRPTVTWNAVVGATDYEIWIKNQSTGKDQVLLAQVSGTSFTPSTDLGIGNFTVWVRTLGINAGPASFWSAQHNFRINTAVVQNAVAPDPFNTMAMLSWQVLPGAVSYDVWVDRLDVPTSEIFRHTTDLPERTSLTMTTLPRGIYRSWVRGIAADGAAGAWSAPRDFSAETIPLIASGINPTFDTTPTVTWTAVPGNPTYEVYVLSIHGNFKALHQKNISGTSFTWPALPAGPYRYWVRATGSTLWSPPVEIDTRGRTDVLGPVGSITDRTPTISWRPVDGVFRFELWVDQLGVREKIIYETSLSVNAYTPPTDLPTGNYRVWVRAVGSSLTAPWSAPVEFTIAGATLPLTPSTDSDLLASVFSDPLLLPALGESQSLSSDSAAQTASANPNAPPEDPRRLSNGEMTAFQSVATPTSEVLAVLDDLIGLSPGAEVLSLDATGNTGQAIARKPQVDSYRRHRASV